MCDCHTETDNIDKHREGQENIRVTFIDLEKPYDHIHREEILRCSMERTVPVKYNSFVVEVGLKPINYLFLMLMDALTEDVRKDVPGSMMLADDIVLCGDDNTGMTEYLDTWRR